MRITRQLSTHFKLKKLICPCCKRVMINDRFYRHMEILEEIRVLAGFPIIVTSGYRCPLHNESIGGGENSQHLLFATDFRPMWGTGFPQRLRLLYNETNKRFKGVGKYKSWVHGDLRSGKKARWAG